MSTDPQQFSVYWCNLEPSFGYQMKKTRPCAIVSPNEMNEKLGTVIVVPLASTVSKFPFYTPVRYQDHKGALVCDQIKTIDKRRIGNLFAQLSGKDARAVNNTLCSMFQLSL